jgi:hypothetical protein
MGDHRVYDIVTSRPIALYTFFRINNLTGSIHVSVKITSVFYLPRNMTQRPTEFRAGKHVHKRIVDTVKQKSIAQVGHHLTENRTIATELDAPVNCNRRARYRKCTQPKR